MLETDKRLQSGAATQPPPTDDEGGLRAPPELKGWRKAWWWFDFIILVKVARLRFIAILAVIGVVITQWDTLLAYYDKWTRPSMDVAKAASNVEYFCPMHPSVVRNDPKEKCPICFMPLSKRTKGDHRVEALPAGIVNRVQLSPYRVALAGVNTWNVDYVPLTKEIVAVGYIEFNERGQRTVAARAAGRIDKLMANETGQMVHAGDALASLYSPDLFATAQNLRQALQSGNRENLDSLKTRLRLQGIDDAQIDEILNAPQVDPHLTIRSPIGGHIITKYVREGQYVEEGAPLYELADLSSVWIQAQVYEDDMAFLPMADEHGTIDAAGLAVSATTRAFPDHKFVGKLAFIYPHVDQSTRTATVRFELDNPEHQLRPGSTATVTLKIRPQDVPSLAAALQNSADAKKLDDGNVLAVPESAVIDTGGQRIVYRERSPGLFEGVEVVLAPLMTDPAGVRFYPVLRGLIAGDAIVTSGSFLVDAETRLNPSAGSIYFGGSGSSQSDKSAMNVIRPSTPANPDASIEASLTSLSPEDRTLADRQRICPVLPDNRLGTMGVPVKVLIDGEPVFLCCSGCRTKALANPKQTLAKVMELRRISTKESHSPAMEAPMLRAGVGAEEAISDALNELTPEVRALAQAQRFCAVLTDNRLGTMGAPLLLNINGQPVFICCPGCKEKALANPQATLAAVAQLLQSNATAR